MAKQIIILVLCFVKSQCIDYSMREPLALSGCEQVPKPGLEFYCVVPNCDVPCPRKCSSGCNDLQFFTSNITDYFVSHTQFVFIDGTHEHIHTLKVEEVNNLTFVSMAPEDHVIIHCPHELETGFFFSNCSNISISNITFFNCGQKFHSIHFQLFQSALAFVNISYLALDGVNISNSITQGLSVIGVRKSLSIKASSFIQSGYGRNQTTSDSYIGGNSIFAEEDPDNRSENVSIDIDYSSFISNINRPECADARDLNNDLQYCKCDHLASGLAIIVRRLNVSVSLTNLIFRDNLGCNGGNLAIIINTTNPFVGNLNLRMDNCTIVNGTATFGGGLYVFYLPAPVGYSYDKHLCSKSSNDVISIINTLFQNNTALSGGGAYLKLTASLSACNPTEISLSKNCTFIRNSLSNAGYGGVGFTSITYVSFEYMKQITPQFEITIRDSTFTEHYYTSSSKWNNSGSGVIYLKTNRHVMIENITIYGNSYSGIVIVDSNLVVSGSVEIYNNSGSSGGGMLFCSNAVMFLKPNAQLNITNNRAEHAGGGICVEDQCLQSKPMCFFQLDYNASIDPENSDSIKVLLIDNNASYAGNQIYGGSIDFCYIINSPFDNISRHEGNDSLHIYYQLFEIYPNDTHSVTSPQRQVCMCKETSNGTIKPDCSNDDFNLPTPVFPGQNFTVLVTIVGQLGGLVPGTVYAKLQSLDSETEQSLPKEQEVNKVNSTCANLTYTIYTNQNYAKMSLSIQFVGDMSFADHLSFFRPQIIHVDIYPCPIGFILTKTKRNSHIEWKCDCLKNLNQEFRCFIANKSIIAKSGNWIGYSENEYNATHNGTILFSIGCTLDYCKNTNPDYLENLTAIQTEANEFINQDNQCEFNRTGVLCGKCPANYSTMLGGSNCSPNCSNTTLLLVPLFAVMGVLLVVLLMALNMTVTEGTINGLLFYANIVQISNKVFFRGQSIHFLTPFLKVFLAWLNLDFGISVCLYKGMDDYSKAWLQFIFPLFIWTITGVIIYLSRRFTMVARLVNRNGTKVLATLVLLSYAKMMRASIVALHFKKVTHINLNGTFLRESFCWYSDCTVQFMKGKHIPLGLVGALSIVCLLPFALLLLFTDVLNKIPFLSCMWKLKPFLDTYTGPYTNEGRYWTGLLLVLRCCLFLVSFLNHASRSTSLSISVASLVMIIILIVPWLLRTGIYRKRWLNILECSILLNLAVFTTATQYLLFYRDNYEPINLTHLSVGIAFITFILILLYHICQFESIQRLYSKVKRMCLMIKAKIRGSINRHDGTYNDPASDSDEDLLSVSNFPPFTPTDIDREPLLSDNSS